MSVVYIGIGSNLDDRKTNCIRAIALLRDKGITVTNCSSMYETEPWGMKEQPLFINMAVEIETGISPEEFLALLKDVEREIGRKSAAKWGPRIIDLDILLFDDIVISSEKLTIPHPYMHERNFVLAPLAEIAPSILHPVLRKSISVMRSELFEINEKAVVKDKAKSITETGQSTAEEPFRT